MVCLVLTRFTSALILPNDVTKLLPNVIVDSYFIADVTIVEISLCLVRGLWGRWWRTADAAPLGTHSGCLNATEKQFTLLATLLTNNKLTNTSC